MQKDQLESVIARLEAFYVKRGDTLTLAETFVFFDALAAIKEAAR